MCKKYVDLLWQLEQNLVHMIDLVTYMCMSFTQAGEYICINVQ